MTYYNENMMVVLSVLGILIIFFHYFSTLHTDDHFAFGITIPNFSIDTVGDWGCTADTLNTVKKIEQLNPNLVLALGDLSYATTGDCWIMIQNPLRAN